MTLFGFVITSAMIWLALAAIFAIIEALTMGLTTIWFTGGAIAAALTAIFDLPVYVQIAVFIIVSVLLIYFTRPLVKKRLKVGSEKTNIDAIIGKEGIVTRDIKPFSTGTVKIEGMSWTAISKDSNVPINQGSTVKVLEIEGVKLIVSPIK